MELKKEKLTFVEVLIMGATIVAGLFMAAGVGMLFS